MYVCLYAAVEGWIIMVTGLHEEAQEDDIYDNFGQFGQIKNLHLNLDRRTTFAKGYALLEYDQFQNAAKAIEKMNGKEIYDKSIRVDWAFKKPPVKKDKTKDRKHR